MALTEPLSHVTRATPSLGGDGLSGPGAPTLFLPRGRTREDSGSGSGSTLPDDLREQAVLRLRLIPVAYSMAFFLADFLPSILTGQIGGRFQNPLHWVPSAVSIVVGLAVAAIASNPRLS